MIKRLIQILGFIFILSSCINNDKYIIEGKIKNLTDEDLYVVFESDDLKDVDTISCDKPGEFLITKQGSFDQVTIYTCNKEQWITAYPEKGQKVSITGDWKDPISIDIKGGEVNDQLRKYKKELDPLLKEKAKIVKAWTKNNGSIGSEQAELSARLANVNLQLKENAEKLIRKYPNQKASSILIERLFMIADNSRKIDELLAILEPSARDFFLVSKLEAFSNRAKRTETGAEAPDFTVNNIYGKPLTLDSFPNKYLLLAFTASWHELGQSSHQYLADIKKQYKDKELEVVLVSLDTDTKEIRESMAKDSLQWNLVTDSAGQSSSLIDLYNISVLPRCFLIDKEGEILIKTDNGLELKETMEDLLEE